MVVGSMNCFPCCTAQKSKKSREDGSPTAQEAAQAKTPDMKKHRGDEANQFDTENINAQHFTFRELATATKNFRQECLLGEDGFGRVYKGTIPATGQAVAVKQLDRHGAQSSKEFLADVAELSLLHHDNLVNLIGYCADGDQRLLVYEFILGCTLEECLFENKAGRPALNWFDRMKVAAGASRGLEYLHESVSPPVIYRDLRSAHFILDDDFNVRLCNFGMIKLSGGDKMNHAPPRVMGTYGYCAPEYVRTGHVTLKSDVYSFGVVLLELITGRRVIDTTRPSEEQNLVSWAQHFFRDPKRYPDMADPLINKQFPEKDLNQAVAIAAMCLQEEAEARPLISDVVTALSFLSMVPPDVIPPPLHPATSASKKSCASESQWESESESGSESGSEDSSEDEKGEGSGHKDNKASKKHDAAKEKYQESDVIDIEDDYYKDENPHGSNGPPLQMFNPKESRKSSTRSRNGTLNSDSEDGSVSSSSKSSRKSRGVAANLSQKKTSRKSSSVSKKSSRKSSTKRDLSHKRSGKSCASSSTVGSEDGGVLLEGSSSRISQGGISFGLTSNGSVESDLNSNSRRAEEESIHLDHACSIESDEGSDHPFDIISSNGSDTGSVHAR